MHECRKEHPQKTPTTKNVRMIDNVKQYFDSHIREI